MKNKLLVGITGHMGVGKTTAALILAQYEYKIIKFADPLKNMLRAIGMVNEQLEGSLKNIPCDWLGNKTPRQIMQLCGTEFGRKMIDENIWVNAWQRKLVGLSRVVSDDVRFPNEALRIKELGGVLIKIKRPGYDGDTHDSEKFIDELPWDHIIYNNSSIKHFESAMEELINSCGLI